jgi:hypothetical protein
VPAHAHLGQVILRAQRYLKLDASDADTRLVVSLTLGPSEGERVLAEADTDGDHVVSEAESTAYMAQWGESLETDLPVEIDGAPIHAGWTDGYMDPIGPVAPMALTVEITAHLPVPRREHVVRFRDRMRRDVFDETEIAFRAHDGASLVSAGPGEQPTGVENDLSFVRPTEPPEVLTASLRFPNHSDASPTNVAVPIAIGVVLIVGVALYRRRKR